MKKPAAKAKKRAKLLAACAKARETVGRMSDDERQRLQERALQLIYSSDATASTRSR